MRTTLTIAGDVLFTAKDFARRDKKTLDLVISKWAAASCKTRLLCRTQPSAKQG